MYNSGLDQLREKGLYNSIFQHLTIALPFASERGKQSFVLRPVMSEDVMTARFAWLEMELLKIAKLDFVDSLYFDATNKPPATFGWE